MKRPSGLNEAVLTASELAESGRRSVASQSRAVPSEPAVATMLPSRLNPPSPIPQLRAPPERGARLPGPGTPDRGGPPPPCRDHNLRIAAEGDVVHGVRVTEQEGAPRSRSREPDDGRAARVRRRDQPAPGRVDRVRHPP